MPKKTDAGNPADWMAFVREDLAAVSLLLGNQVSFHVCRSKLSEALEKALKADLIRRGWSLVKVHDLPKLCDLLAGYSESAADRLQQIVDELAESYTESRYPGFDLDQPDWEGLRRQVVTVQGYVDDLRKVIPPSNI